MGRKHKFVNKTHYPDYVIERFTRCIYDDVIAFFATEEGRAEYEAWEAEQAALKSKKRAAKTSVNEVFGVNNSELQTEELKKNKRAATTEVVAALVRYLAFFLCGPLGFDSGRISQPFAKYVSS